MSKISQHFTHNDTWWIYIGNHETVVGFFTTSVCSLLWGSWTPKSSIPTVSQSRFNWFLIGSLSPGIKKSSGVLKLTVVQGKYGLEQSTVFCHPILDSGGNIPFLSHTALLAKKAHRYSYSLSSGLAWISNAIKKHFQLAKGRAAIICYGRVQKRPLLTAFYPPSWLLERPLKQTLNIAAGYMDFGGKRQQTYYFATCNGGKREKSSVVNIFFCSLLFFTSFSLWYSNQHPLLKLKIFLLHLTSTLYFNACDAL